MAAQFPHRGEVWQIQFPEETKRRPGLIISVDQRNRFANSVLAIPITSNLQPAPTHVLLPSGQAGLRHASMARCENLNWVRKDRGNRGGLSGFVSPALFRVIE